MTVSWKPAVCSVTFRQLAPGAIIELCTGAGIDTIEWGGDVHVPCGDLDTAREVGAQTRASGLGVGSYGTYLFAGSQRAPRGGPPPEPANLMATALALGAPALRVWAGAGASADASSATRAAVAAALREVCAAAAEHWLAVTLEYHPNTLTDDVDSTLSLLDAVGADNLFTHWQPRPGLDVDTALGELDRLGPWLSYLHVFAWDGEGTRYPLAEHAHYWPAVFERINRLAPNSAWPAPRWACLEFVRDDAPEQFRQDAATLRNWIG